MRGYITLLSSRDYIKGVLILNKSLKDVGSKYGLTVLISKDLYDSFSGITELLSFFDVNYEVLDKTFSLPEEISKKIHSRRWIKTFDKLQVFGFTKFNKIVFLDSDMLIIRNIDILFDQKHLTFAAASENVSGYESWNLPNTGMMVIEPEIELPKKIFGSWPEVQSKKNDFSDQDLIHSFYGIQFWKDNEWRVAALYNCFVFLIDKIVNERKYNLNLEKPDSKTIAVLHFAIKERPWMMNRRERFLFYLTRFFAGKFQEIKAYRIYFRYLSQINEKRIPNSEITFF